MYSRLLIPAADTRSWTYQPVWAATQSGVDLICYEYSDLFSAAIPAALGTTLLANPVKLSEDFAGIHALAADVRLLRSGINRSMDHSPFWAPMNPSSGVFVDPQGQMEAWLKANQANGTKSLWQIYQCPPWASARPAEGPDAYGVPGGKAEPANMANLASYVTWGLQRFPGLIHYVGVWNEPKMSYAIPSSYFSGTASAWARVAKTIYQAVKAIDPTILVLGPDTTGMDDTSPGGGVDYCNQVLGASDGSGGFGKNWIDLLSVHTYVHDDRNTLSNLIGMKTNIDGIKATNSIPTMSVWSTEFGYISPTFNKYTGPPAARVGAMMRFFLMNVVAGMDRAIIYAYANATMGWSTDLAMLPIWNEWIALLNGATITRINTIGTNGQLACIINGKNYLV